MNTHFQQDQPQSYPNISPQLQQQHSHSSSQHQPEPTSPLPSPKVQQQEQTSPPPSQYSYSQQINLFQLQPEPKPQTIPNKPQPQQKQQQSTKITISKTNNPSLLDLQLIDINITDNNTNLLDIISPNNQSDIIKFLDGRQITINNETEIISEGYITSYKLYTIISKSKYGGETTEVKRRFSDFEFLQELLFNMHPGRIIPVLPEKNIWASLNMEGEEYSLERIRRLKRYVDSLLMNEKLRVTPELRLFLFDSSNEFSEMKGEYEEKSKLQDKVKTVANRVYDIGKGFITSLISRGNTTQTKFSIEYITKDNIQITQLCLKLKSLYQNIHKIKPQILSKLKQFQLISRLNTTSTHKNKTFSFNLQINVNTKEITNDLKESFEDTEYYIESCWQVMNRYQKLYEELELLKKEEENMMKKYKDNPRSKDMDLLKTKTKRLSERLDRSNGILHEEIKIGTLRAEFLFKSLLDVYLKYKKIEYL